MLRNLFSHQGQGSGGLPSALGMPEKGLRSCCSRAPTEAVATASAGLVAAGSAREAVATAGG